jgi:hypothetical protein
VNSSSSSSSSGGSCLCAVVAAGQCTAVVFCSIHTSHAASLVVVVVTLISFSDPHVHRMFNALAAAAAATVLTSCMQQLVAVFQPVGAIIIVQPLHNVFPVELFSLPAR